jgi:hypothetical protein
MQTRRIFVGVGVGIGIGVEQSDRLTVSKLASAKKTLSVRVHSRFSLFAPAACS